MSGDASHLWLNPEPWVFIFLKPLRTGPPTGEGCFSNTERGQGEEGISLAMLQTDHCDLASQIIFSVSNSVSLCYNGVGVGDSWYHRLWFASQLCAFL